MLNSDIQQFFKTCSEDSAKQILKTCKDKQLFNIGEKIGKCFMELFPHLHIVSRDTAICAKNNKHYENAFNIFCSLLKLPNISEDLEKELIEDRTSCVPYVCDNFTYYNPEIVKKIMNRHEKPFKLVTFTITTCKRYDLFEQTINSFLNCCTDLDKIDFWVCVDDNSSEEDRQKMKSKYPFFDFYFKKVNEKGHPLSMNIIKSKVKTPYIFHMEDDWKFFEKRNYISDCFNVLHTNPKIGQCLINKNYIETNFINDITGGYRNKTVNGLTYYTHEYCPTQEELQAFYKKYGVNCKQCAYWPHFSFRPSLLRTSVLTELGTFNEKTGHFEMEYAYRYIKAGYISAFFDSFSCLHTGRLTSERFDKSKTNAYELNNESQFIKNEQPTPPQQQTPPQKPTHERSETQKFLQKQIVPDRPFLPPQPPRAEYVKQLFKIFVINLDRREDRWKKFNENIHEPRANFDLPIHRFSAVDGNKLKSNPQLCRIFDGNDYNMKTGMVGCAMSHIKLYTDLINSDSDFYVILEDDIECTPNFKDKLIHTLKTAPSNWDMIYLGHHLFPELKKPEYYDKEATPVLELWSKEKSLKQSMGGTGGYAITRHGAQRLLDFINTIGMVNCIDTMQQNSADTLNIYYTKPHLIFAECYTGQNADTLDTDIQFETNSLTVSIDKRFEEELLFCANNNPHVELDFYEMKRISLGEAPEGRERSVAPEGRGVAQPNSVYIYKSDNDKYILHLKQICVYPCYTLDNKVFVLLSGVEGRYLHRFKKDKKYDVSDALTFK